MTRYEEMIQKLSQGPVTNNAAQFQSRWEQAHAQPTTTTTQTQTQQKGPLESVLGNIGDTLGAFGNTIKDTIGAVGSVFTTQATNTMRDNLTKQAKDARDKVAKQFGYESYSSAPDEAWDNQNFVAAIKAVNAREQEGLNKIREGYNNDWFRKNTAEVKQGDYGSNALKTMNAAMDAAQMAYGGGGLAGLALNGVQGYMTSLADDLKGKDTVFDLEGRINGKPQETDTVDWGKVGEEGTINALSGIAGGLAGDVTGSIGGKLLGSNNILGRLGGKALTSAPIRGAISGGVGGATGAYANTRLNGGTLEEALANSAAAAGQGAGQGALMSTGMSLLGKGINKAKNAFENSKQQDLAENNRLLEQEAEASQPLKDVSDDEEGLYGRSRLAENTGNQNLGKKIEKIGQFVEGSQAGGTRAETREILGGKRSVGEAIDSVRKRTGISDLDAQSQLATEITGKNGTMDLIQKDFLSYGEDGKPITIKTNDIADEIPKIVNSNVTKSTGVNRENLIASLQEDLLNPDTNAFDLANDLRSQANTLLRKGKINPSTGDEAKAKVLNITADKLEDSFYKQLSNEQIDGMYDATIKEFRNRAATAKSNNNKKVSKAYDMLADELSTQDRSVKNYRKFKKDFVDVNKIYTKVAAASQVGSRSNLATGIAAGVLTKDPLAGVAATLAPKLLTEPVNDALGWAGGKITDIGAKIASNPDGGVNTIANTTKKVGSLLDLPTDSSYPGAMVGRISGQNVANNLEEQLAGMSTQNASQTAMNGLNGSYYAGADVYGNTATPTAYGSSYNTQTNAGADMTNRIQLAIELALEAGDLNAVSQLVNIYNDLAKIMNAYQPEGLKESKTTSDLNATQQQNIANLKTASSALDELESLYNQAGGGRGIFGNVSNFFAGLGMNPNVKTYNDLAQGLINQIGAAIGKTDSLNTEGEVDRALSLVPKITDDAQTAKNKLAELRKMLAITKQNYSEVYGINL